MDEPHQIAPGEAVLDDGGGALADGRPGLPQQRLESDAVFVGRPQLHRRLGEDVGDFNHQAHFAHQQREDGLRTPSEVLGDARGRQVAVPTLQHLFELLLTQRKVDAQGYIRYHHWRVYGDEGLAGTQASVWLGKETRTLTLAYDGAPLAQYAVSFNALDLPGAAAKRRKKRGKRSRRITQQPPKRQQRSEIADLQEAYRFPSPRPSLQPHLWDEEISGRIEWRKVYRLPAYAPRRPRSAPILWQAPLLTGG